MKLEEHPRYKKYEKLLREQKISKENFDRSIDKLKKLLGVLETPKSVVNNNKEESKLKKSAKLIAYEIESIVPEEPKLNKEELENVLKEEPEVEIEETKKVNKEQETKIKPVNAPKGWHRRNLFIDEVGNMFERGKYIGRKIKDLEETE